MLKSIPKLLSAASIVLFSCGPMHDTGSVLLNDEEYASTRQAIESENTDELIGSYTKRDLFVPHQTGVRLVKGGGLSCEVALGYRADCTGAVLNAQDEDGALQLRVDSRSGGLYRVSYRRGTSGDFTALCRSTIDKPAIVLPGSWNKNADRLKPFHLRGLLLPVRDLRHISALVSINSTHWITRAIIRHVHECCVLITAVAVSQTPRKARASTSRIV